MPRGGKTSYREEYCREVIEYIAKGHSIKAFAGYVSVDRTTVFDWLKKYPDFAEAMEIATAKCVAYWEDRLIECAETGKGNVTAIIFGLKNRAHEDWRDVHRTEHTGKDGGAIEVTNVTTEQRARALAAFVEKTKAEPRPLN